MSKFKIIFVLLFITCIVTTAHSQEEVEDPQVITITGTVIKNDFVASSINVQTNDGPMAFSVPGNATITLDTKDIGLMEVKQGNPVTIRYYLSSEGRYVVVSIINNQPK